jgi:hypothetical protein
MSRKSSQRKRIRQRKRFEQRSQELPAPVSAITGLEQAVFQTPTRSDIRRISTSVLIAELQRRPDSRGLIAAIAEANMKGL